MKMTHLGEEGTEKTTICGDQNQGKKNMRPKKKIKLTQDTEHQKASQRQSSMRRNKDDIKARHKDWEPPEEEISRQKSSYIYLKKEQAVFNSFTSK